MSFYEKKLWDCLSFKVSSRVVYIPEYDPWQDSDNTITRPYKLNRNRHFFDIWNCINERLHCTYTRETLQIDFLH